MSKYPISPSDALALLSQIVLKPLTYSERQAFQGCESPNPRIGYLSLGGINFTLLVDGTQLLIVQEGDDSGGTQFNLELL